MFKKSDDDDEEDNEDDDPGEWWRMCFVFVKSWFESVYWDCDVDDECVDALAPLLLLLLLLEIDDGKLRPE